MGLNWINTVLTKWAFALFLLKNAYTEEQIRAFLSEAGIAQSRIQSAGVGFEIWLEK